MDIEGGKRFKNLNLYTYHESLFHRVQIYRKVFFLPPFSRSVVDNLSYGWKGWIDMWSGAKPQPYLLLRNNGRANSRRRATFLLIPHNEY